MRVVKPGHRYELDHIDGDGKTYIQFVDRGYGNDSEGITNQELIRVLIDRIKFLDGERKWEGNQKILQSLRIALVLHEVRHIERLVDKNMINPELIKTKKDGHWIISDLTT